MSSHASTARLSEGRATPPKATTDDLDAARALRARWTAAAEAVLGARHRGKTANALASAVFPDLPTTIEDPNWPGTPRARVDLERDPRNAELDLVGRYDRWHGEVSSLERTHRLAEIEAAIVEAEGELSAAGARLAAIRPTTIAEAAWKLQAIIGLPEEESETSLTISAAQAILDDLERLGGAALT